VELLDDQGNSIDAETVGLTDVNFPINTNAVASGTELSIAELDANGLTLTLLDVGGAALNGTYRIVTTITNSTGSEVLDSGVMTLDCAQTIALGDSYGAYTVNTLMLPAAINDATDPHGPLSAPLLGDQQIYLEDLLTRNGWSYTIVTNNDDFAYELHTGGYAAYALFSEQVKLDEQVQKELREAAFRGEGLLVAGSHDNRNHTVFDALGVKLQGKLSDADGVQLTNSMFTTQPELTFSYLDKVLRMDLLGSVVDSGYLTLVDGVYTPQADGDAAITTFDYGYGRGVFVGFDLLAQATAVGLDNGFGDILLAALEYIQPPVESVSEGVIPVQVTLTNLGIATPGVAIIGLTGGATVIDPGAATAQSPTQLSWSYDLELDGTETLTFWMKLPVAPASATVEALIQTGVSPDLLDYDQLALTITPLASATVSDALAELGPIAADNKADKAYSRAQGELERAQASLDAADYAKAMRDLLGATDELSTIPEAEVDRIRHMVNEVIRDVGRLL
jgi:hypothetical protein